MKKSFNFLLLLLVTNSGFSQSYKQLRFNFAPIYQAYRLKLNEGLKSEIKSDSLTITKLKFYISNVVLKNADTLVFEDNQRAHLIDIENSLSFSLNGIPSHIQYDQMEFGLGIDSITNIKGALDGELDPTLGMYWTWQSGYINFKLEGKYFGQHSSETEFEYHLGGYAGSKNAYTKIKLPLNNNSEEITVFLDLSRFLKDKQVMGQDRVMSPGEIAVNISKSLAQCFDLK